MKNARRRVMMGSWFALACGLAIGCGMTTSEVGGVGGQAARETGGAFNGTSVDAIPTTGMQGNNTLEQGTGGLSGPVEAIPHAVWHRPESLAVLSEDRPVMSGFLADDLPEVNLSICPPKTRAPHVAVAGTGDAMVQFVDELGLWVRHYRKATERWAESVQLAPAGAAADARLAMDAQGNAVVAWTSCTGVSQLQRFTASRDGVGLWSPPEAVGSQDYDFGATQFVTAVKMTPEGDFAVTWETIGGVYARVYEAKHGWDRIIKAGGDLIEASSVDLARWSDQLRLVIVSNDRSQNATTRILGTIYDMALTTHAITQGKLTVLEDVGTAQLGTSSVRTGLDGRGNIFVGFSTLRAAGHGYILRRYSNNWENPVELATQGEPRLAVAANGEALAVYRNEMNPSTSIQKWGLFASTFSANTWQPEKPLSDANQDPMGETGWTVAFNEAGQGVVAWTNSLISGSPGFDFLATESQSGGTWTAPHSLRGESPPDDFPGLLDLKLGSDGTAVASWLQQDVAPPNNNRVMAAVYH